MDATLIAVMRTIFQILQKLMLELATALLLVFYLLVDKGDIPLGSSVAKHMEESAKLLKWNN
jgi:hypothetical protein